MNLTEVTSDEFYRALTADRRDIMPTIVGSYERHGRGYVQEWRTNNSSRVLFGVTHGGDFPFTSKRYFVVGSSRP